MESCCIDKLQARVENLSAKKKEKKKGNEDCRQALSEHGTKT